MTQSKVDEEFGLLPQAPHRTTINGYLASVVSAIFSGFSVLVEDISHGCTAESVYCGLRKLVSSCNTVYLIAGLEVDSILLTLISKLNT